MAKKQYQVDQNLINDIQADTKRIEKKHQKKKRAQRKKKAEAEDLSQRWLAPLLLFATLTVAYLLYLIY